MPDCKCISAFTFIWVIFHEKRVTIQGDGRGLFGLFVMKKEAQYRKMEGEEEARPSAHREMRACAGPPWLRPRPAPASVRGIDLLSKKQDTCVCMHLFVHIQGIV